MQLKSGATRHVLLVGRWAIKIPRLTRWINFLQGLLANMQEVAFAPISDLLCPVLWTSGGGWIVVMARAEPLTDAELAVILSWESHGMVSEPFPLAVEAKPCSFGKLGGRIVAVDYGS